MELFAGLAVLAMLVVGLVLILKASFWLIFFVVLPLFWLWMLIDAIARRDEDYPSKSKNEKILWVVLILVLQVTAAVYWLVVYRPARQRMKAYVQPASHTAPVAPPPPSAV